MSTIGDLTLNDIGRTRITVRYQGATVSGLLTEIEINTEVNRIRSLGAVDLGESYAVRADIRIGQILLCNLTRDTKCEVLP